MSACIEQVAFLDDREAALLVSSKIVYRIVSMIRNLTGRGSRPRVERRSYTFDDIDGGPDGNLQRKNGSVEVRTPGQKQQSLWGAETKASERFLFER